MHVVHADMPASAGFGLGARLSGVFDFYFAGVDCLLYDVAVCANDWCLADPQRDRQLDGARLQAFLGAYHALRPFGAEERDAWPAQLRAAALRFWLSRLHDLHLPRPGELVHAHDPAHFRDILERRVAEAPPWLAAA
jgi:homoserine kinase type II